MNEILNNMGIKYFNANSKPTKKGRYLWRKGNGEEARIVRLDSFDPVNRVDGIWRCSNGDFIGYIEDYPDSEFVGPITEEMWGSVFEIFLKILKKNT